MQRGKSLGIFKPSSESLRIKRKEVQEGFHVELLHRAVPVLVTPEGIRATAKGKPSNPASVEKYLASKFGGHLEAVSRAMAELAKSYPPEALAGVAFNLYEKFRPSVPQGTEGWGAAGILDIAVIRRLARGH